jgi:hypothetical protein
MIIIKAIVLLIMVQGSVTILFPYFLLTSRFKLFFPDIGIFRFLGLIPILRGAAIAFWGRWDFIFTGKGTPAPIVGCPRNIP